MALTVPLVHFFAHTTPSTSLPLYRKQVLSPCCVCAADPPTFATRCRCSQVQELAAHVRGRIASHPDPKTRFGGVFINTCGWVDGDGYDLLIFAAKTFQVDAILVLGDERLHSQLQADPQLAPSTRGEWPTAPLAITRLMKSGGVVVRDANARRAARNRMCRQYFYGADETFKPTQMTLGFKDFRMFRVGGGPQAPSHVLPLGAKPLLDPNKLEEVPCTHARSVG